MTATVTRLALLTRTLFACSAPEDHFSAKQRSSTSIVKYSSIFHSKTYAVLLKADTQRSLLKVITSRQIRFFGHVLRKNELEAIVLTGKIEGKRARGRQRKMF